MALLKRYTQLVALKPDGKDGCLGHRDGLAAQAKDDPPELRRLFVRVINTSAYQHDGHALQLVADGKDAVADKNEERH